MFPQRLDSPLAYDIAKAMMDGFNRHYRLFRTESARAKHRFETADWHGQQRAQRERIEFYDLRVKRSDARGWRRSSRPASSRWTCGSRSSCTTSACWSTTTSPSWPRPSSTRSPPRSCTARYFHNDFIFVRPGGQHRVHRERRAGRHAHLPRLLPDARQRCARPSCASSTTSSCSAPFDDLERDAGMVLEAMSARLAQVKLRANFQIQVLSRLFFRNKGAYVVGKIINGFNEVPFALPILHNKAGQAGDRRLPVRRGRPADAVQLRARLLHGRHGGAQRPTCSSCAR